jgi:hypothetical protein
LCVAALTLITNFAAGFSGGNPNRHEETHRTALAGTIGLKRLLRNFLETKDEAWAARSKAGVARMILRARRTWTPKLA